MEDASEATPGDSPVRRDVPTDDGAPAPGDAVATWPVGGRPRPQPTTRWHNDDERGPRPPRAPDLGGYVNCDSD
jgi:hypothetical protein